MLFNIEYHFSNEDLDILIDNEPSTSGLCHAIDNSHTRKKVKKVHSACSERRQEEISQALARMISVNMLPISFCNSGGFKEFMAVLEPGYQCPCPQSLLSRLEMAFNEKRRRIEDILSNVPCIAMTIDGWSSRSLDSYISATGHFINDDWILKSYTLSTQLIEDRHTAENLKTVFTLITEDWNISEKVNAVVHDNASNITVAVDLLDEVRYSIPCAAHTLQLCIKDAVSAIESFEIILKKGSKIVQHFNHSNLATSALSDVQRQLNLKQQKLIQYCTTRWDSMYHMCERLVANRNAVVAVLADRSLTKLTTALKLEMSELDWTEMKTLTNILKPFQLATTILCSETDVTLSLVLPIVYGIINNHLDPSTDDTDNDIKLKTILKTSLLRRFHIQSNVDNYYHIASFLDPRSKDLSFESNDVKERVHSEVRRMVNETDEIGITASSSSHTNDSYPSPSTALDFIYQSSIPNETSVSEFEKYISETQINHNLNPLAWWKSKQSNYRRLSKIAKIFLGIPATSASSERVFSTAGNIVSPKRSSLLPQNVNMLVFLYKNKDV